MSIDRIDARVDELAASCEELREHFLWVSGKDDARQDVNVETGRSPQSEKMFPTPPIPGGDYYPSLVIGDVVTLRELQTETFKGRSGTIVSHDSKSNTFDVK